MFICLINEVSTFLLSTQSEEKDQNFKRGRKIFRSSGNPDVRIDHKLALSS
jgi:hypothetical protein